MPKVTIVSCPTYDQPQVDAAVKKSLALIGGLENIIKPGAKVLIKVNLLMAADPAQMITTHPAVVAAIIKEIKKLGGIPLVGDSPGNPQASYQKTMEKAGLAKVCRELDAKIISFQESGLINVPSPSQHKTIPAHKIAKAVLDSDVIINVPKLKTHTWTLYTGAIKNLFGCVPGFYKSKYHSWAPQPYDFSRALVDILEIVKPRLHIMDGVYGMEGRGPSAGQTRFMGAIFASRDSVALDAICSTAIGYKPLDIDTTKIAHERKLGEADLTKIEIVGEKLSTITKSDWRHANNTYSLTKIIPGWLSRRMQPIVSKLIRVDPFIVQDRCAQCQICLKNCPAKTIHQINGKIVIDLSQCIMCYCCHELCPDKAIELRASWLAKRLGLA